MTRRVLLLRPHELQGLVTMQEAIDIVEQGYREARSYPAISAPRRRVHSLEGVRVSNFPGGIRLRNSVVTLCTLFTILIPESYYRL